MLNSNFRFPFPSSFFLDRYRCFLNLFLLVEGVFSSFFLKTLFYKFPSLLSLLLSLPFCYYNLLLVKARTCQTLRDYLTCEWKERCEGQDARVFNKVNMPGCSPKVSVSASCFVWR